MGEPGSGDASRLEQARALFDAVRALPPDEQEPFLCEQCAGDERLREQVKGLLESDRRRDGLLETPPPPGVTLGGGEAGDGEWDGFLEQVRSRGPNWTRYQDHGLIGKGGQGFVHRVYDRDLRRNLAMKTILVGGDDQGTAGPAIDPAQLGRFLEEAQVTAQLDHPGIVAVHEVSVDDRGRPYFTMKEVKGEDLKSVYRKLAKDAEGWNLTRLLSVLLRACEAMAYAHDKGVIHRDLKPANVMVGRYGQVYVMDWGLARIVGTTDKRDLRLAPQADAGATANVASLRRDLAAATPGGSLHTIDGAWMGTPTYMSPEQALGEIERMGPATDVYAVGCMLYHAVTGRAPFDTGEPDLSPYVVWQRVCQAPPAGVRELTTEVPAELTAIIEKAMARRIEERYPDMTALATDLRAYLENRVVAAYESGALAELRKWVKRNPGITRTAAAAVALIAALTTWYVLSLAAKEEMASSRKAEFDQLKGVVLLETALENEKDLYPAWPAKIKAMERWLAEDAAVLLELKPALARTLSDLEERALSWSSDEQERDRATHPRIAELARLKLRVEAARRAQGVRSGEDQPDLPGLSESPEELQDATASDLVEFAWARVGLDEEERILGEEGLALVAAREALSRLEQGDDSIARTELLVTLARASFANGLDDAARSRIDDAMKSASDDRKEALQGVRDSLQESISAWTGEAGLQALTALETDLSTLQEVVSTRQTYRFDDESQQFLYDTLSDLAAKIAMFEAGAGRQVAKRLSWARRIDELTRDHPNAIYSWEEAREAIMAADGVLASDRYAEHPIDLVPQRGLVPIGTNPVTLLWEFYDLRSAYDPTSGLDPAEIAIPVHREDGTLEIREETGLVFVLIPGGTYRIGAQSSDPEAPHHDPQAQGDESPVHEVTLQAYFLSRYEMTQGQWKRIVGENPSMYGPHNYGTNWNAKGLAADLTHPVEQVSWDDCVLHLPRIGLRLPSEAQWEAACRAGTKTPWWTGTDWSDLDEAGNLADQYGKENGAGTWPTWEKDLDDGNTVHARVGSYRANDFGLHDVIGNVWEWCLDDCMSYDNPGRAGDGARLVQGASHRVYRGVSSNGTAWGARSAFRGLSTPTGRLIDLGCRPARGIDP